MQTTTANKFGDKVFKQGVHTHCLQFRKGFRFEWEYRYFTNAADPRREQRKLKAKYMHAVVRYLDTKGCWVG